MAVLLYKLISKLLKSGSGLLVSGLHLQSEVESIKTLHWTGGQRRTANLFLQTDSNDGGPLAAVQRRPVSHVTPGRHGEVAAVLVGHDLLLPGQTNPDYWKCNH